MRARWMAVATLLACGTADAFGPVPHARAAPPVLVSTDAPPLPLPEPAALRTGPPAKTLAEAARTCDAPALREVLDAGADPNDETAEPAPLMLAVASCCAAQPPDAAAPLAAVGVLLARGSEVDRRGARARTALHEAAATCGAGVVDALLVHGADPNALDAGGFTPLLTAVLREHQGVANVLALRGARLSGRNLMLAQRYARTEAMRTLVARTAR